EKTTVRVAHLRIAPVRQQPLSDARRASIIRFPPFLYAWPDLVNQLQLEKNAWIIGLVRLLRCTNVSGFSAFLLAGKQPRLAMVFPVLRRLDIRRVDDELINALLPDL